MAANLKCNSVTKRSYLRRFTQYSYLPVRHNSWLKCSLTQPKQLHSLAYKLPHRRCNFVLPEEGR